MAHLEDILLLRFKEGAKILDQLSIYNPNSRLSERGKEGGDDLINFLQHDDGVPGDRHHFGRIYDRTDRKSAPRRAGREDRQLYPFLDKIYPPEIKENPQSSDLARAELEKMGSMKRREKILSVPLLGSGTVPLATANVPN